MEQTVSDLSQADMLIPTVVRQGYAAQQSEMRTVSTFDWFSKKMLPGLVQAVAIITVAAIGMFGSWLGTLIAGAGMMAFELIRAHFINKADLNRELVLYHKEIAHAVGKSPSEILTVEDMRHAADQKIVGDKVVKPLTIELEHLAYRSRYNFIIGAMRALVTTAGAIVLQGMMGGAKAAWDSGNWTALGGSAAWPLTGTLGMVAGATMAVEKTGKSYFDSHEPLSVYHELTQLQNMSKKQAVNPEPVFEVAVKLDKALAKDIQERLGKPYAELTYRNKMRVMQACENRAHAQALTEAINNDALPVTAIAMSACHQMDWSNVGYAKPADNDGHGQTTPGHHSMSDKSFVSDLMSKRTAKAQTSVECRVF